MGSMGTKDGWNSGPSQGGWEGKGRFNSGQKLLLLGVRQRGVGEGGLVKEGGFLLGEKPKLDALN